MNKDWRHVVAVAVAAAVAVQRRISSNESECALPQAFPHEIAFLAASLGSVSVLQSDADLSGQQATVHRLRLPNGSVALCIKRITHVGLDLTHIALATRPTSAAAMLIAEHCMLRKRTAGSLSTELRRQRLSIGKLLPAPLRPPRIDNLTVTLGKLRRRAGIAVGDADADANRRGSDRFGGVRCSYGDAAWDANAASSHEALALEYEATRRAASAKVGPRVHAAATLPSHGSIIMDFIPSVVSLEIARKSKLLSEVLRRSGEPSWFRWCASRVRPLLERLHAVHVVHNDLHLGNILVRDVQETAKASVDEAATGAVLIVDYGEALLLDRMSPARRRKAKTLDMERLVVIAAMLEKAAPAASTPPLPTPPPRSQARGQARWKGALPHIQGVLNGSSALPMRTLPVARVPAASLTPEAFLEHYAGVAPLIIEGGWSSPIEWTAAMVADRCDGRLRPFVQPRGSSTLRSELPTRLRGPEFLEYMEDPKELRHVSNATLRQMLREATGGGAFPLYTQLRVCQDCPRLQEAVRWPAYFRDTRADYLLSHRAATRATGSPTAASPTRCASTTSDKAGDFDWLSVFIGARGSGYALHQDKWGQPFWLAVAAGQKEAVLFPPADSHYLQVADGQQCGPDGAEGYCVGSGFTSRFDFFDGQWRDKAPPGQEAGATAHLAVLKPGDMLYTPFAWIHQVRNGETPTIGVTANFVDVADVPRMSADLRRLLPLASGDTRHVVRELLECHSHVQQLLASGEMADDAPRRPRTLHERGLRQQGQRCAEVAD
jgi:hypothetical protein